MPSGLWLSNQSITMAAKTRAKGLSLPSKGPIVHCVQGWVGGGGGGGGGGIFRKVLGIKTLPPPPKKMIIITYENCTPLGSEKVVKCRPPLPPTPTPSRLDLFFHHWALI